MRACHATAGWRAMTSAMDRKNGCGNKPGKNPFFLYPGVTGISYCLFAGGIRRCLPEQLPFFSYLYYHENLTTYVGVEFKQERTKDQGGRRLWTVAEGRRKRAVAGNRTTIERYIGRSVALSPMLPCGEFGFRQRRIRKSKTSLGQIRVRRAQRYTRPPATLCVALRAGVCASAANPQAAQDRRCLFRTEFDTLPGEKRQM